MWSRTSVAVIVAVLAAVAVVIYLTAFSSTESDPAADVTRREPAGQPLSVVVLVPGYGGSADSVQALSAALVAAGHQVTTVVLPGDGTGDINAMAPALAGAVQQASASGAPVDVIGFSMGGLVARTWARNLGGADLARRIVTVGTPNAGTETAQLGAVFGACPQACLQMVPGSAFLDGLNEGDPTPDGPAWITVRSSTDDVVRPDATTVMDSASNVLLQAVCDGVNIGHGELVTSRLPVTIVVQAVSQRPWTTPTAADCSALQSG